MRILGVTASRVRADYELIETVYPPGVTSVQFSSIPSEYKHLQIRFTARNITSIASTQINLRLNGITASSYARHSLSGQGTTESSTNALSQNSIALPAALALPTGAGFSSAGVIDILDYTSTTKNKTIRAFYGQITGTDNVFLGSGLFDNTSAINSITLTTVSGAFASTSRFSLYGIMG